MIESNDLVLGIDAGTSGVRACVFDLHGRLVAGVERTYPTTFPKAGWATQNPADWWSALLEAVGNVLRSPSVDAHRVIGLAIDAPCDILVADEAGNPLSDALMWMDLRAAHCARRLTATNDPVLRYCGDDVPAEWPLPKMLWLKENDSRLWDRSARVVEQMTWLTWKLTGEWVAPLNSAAAKWHFRADNGWPRSLLKSVDLEDALDRLTQRVEAMGATGGVLSREAALVLGLNVGIPVAMSGIDAHAGMLGVGVAAPGSLALITGTSTCQLAQSAEPVFDDGLWGPFQSAVIPGEWTIEAGQASTGGTVRWLMEIVGNDWPESTRYESADRDAAMVSPGAEGLVLLDFWQGSRTPIRNANARGTICGLTNGHGAGHLLRAVYEGTAYGNRRILERLSQRNVPIDRIVACGGGIRSRLWLQILADVANVPIAFVTSDDAVALGAAMCAAVAAGAYPDVRAAAAGMSHVDGQVEPNRGLRATYDDGYELYKATYSALKPIFARQADAATGRADR